MFEPQHIERVGYATIGDLVRGDLHAPLLIVLLCGAKLVATCVTLGSGASGGIFSPCMFIGATADAAFAFLSNGGSHL